MSLQFILGGAGQDHREPMVAALAQQVTAQPTDQSYYLVPNHIKFETEVDVLAALKARVAPDQPLFAQTQVQVFSFTRLAWFFMKNEPVYQLPRISTAGLNMLIYQIIQSHADELTIFRGEVDRPGFISQLTTQLAEFKVGQVTAADLLAAIDQLPGKNADLQAAFRDRNALQCGFCTPGMLMAAQDLLKQFGALQLVEAYLKEVAPDDASTVPVKITPERPLPRHGRGGGGQRRWGHGNGGGNRGGEAVNLRIGEVERSRNVREGGH